VRRMLGSPIMPTPVKTLMLCKGFTVDTTIIADALSTNRRGGCRRKRTSLFRLWAPKRVTAPEEHLQ